MSVRLLGRETPVPVVPSLSLAVVLRWMKGQSKYVVGPARYISILPFDQLVASCSLLANSVASSKRLHTQKVAPGLPPFPGAICRQMFIFISRGRGTT